MAHYWDVLLLGPLWTTLYRNAPAFKQTIDQLSKKKKEKSHALFQFLHYEYAFPDQPLNMSSEAYVVTSCKCSIESFTYLVFFRSRIRPYGV